MSGFSPTVCGAADGACGAPLVLTSTPSWSIRPALGLGHTCSSPRLRPRGMTSFSRVGTCLSSFALSVARFRGAGHTGSLQDVLACPLALASRRLPASVEGSFRGSAPMSGICRGGALTSVTAVFGVMPRARRATLASMEDVLSMSAEMGEAVMDLDLMLVTVALAAVALNFMLAMRLGMRHGRYVGLIVTDAVALILVYIAVADGTCPTVRCLLDFVMTARDL
jgi:hypothetical protein